MHNRTLSITRILAVLLLFTLFAGILILPAGAASSSQAAQPAVKDAVINGQKTTFHTYTIRNADYFRLRDLALSFNVTDKQFNIGWDNAAKTISVTSGEPYKAMGGEMAPNGSGRKTAYPVGSSILLDGKPAFPTTYSIDNQTYVKLYDLGAAFDISVVWDAESKQYVVDTDKKYVAPTPTQLAETEEMGQAYLNSIVFLGDSTTYGFQVYGVL